MGGIPILRKWLSQWRHWRVEAEQDVLDKQRGLQDAEEHFRNVCQLGRATRSNTFMES